MKKNYVFGAAVIGASLLVTGMATSLQAAQNTGDSSLQFGGGFFHAQGADVGTLNLEGTYGYFWRKNVEVGLTQSFGYSFIDDGEDEWVGSTIPFVNYHFLGLSTNDTFQPFIGAFIGASYNEDDMTGTLGPQIGFKSFISDTTFITVKYRYEWFFSDLALNTIEDNSSDGNHVITLGLGFTF